MERKLVGWLKAKMKQAGAKGLLCGISGGVDSAVVAALIKKAAGESHLCLIMPCHSVQSDEQDAGFLAEKLALNTKRIDLTAVHDALVGILPDADNIAVANLKPRLRMLTLYYFANKLNYLVVGTGNKSEALMGYFTKFGDGGVDLLPLGNLLKRQVRALAAHLGVPQSIIDKPPSAGLWKSQTDEGEMGIAYAELDAILDAMGNKRSADAPKALIKKIEQRIRASEHKRQGPEIFN